jgi:glycosyltransferase involved in cell wall biosynthesis
MSQNISIIIPTYNRKTFLGKTIRSAMNQTRPPLEIIVVDDGSTDGTKTFILESFGDHVTYLSQENKERGAARNYGASVAKGEYIYFLDSDDLLYADHLEKAAAFLKLHSKPAWFFQEYEIIDNHNHKQLVYNRENPLKSLLTEGNFLSCHGVFIRKDFFEQHRFNENRVLAGSEDYELWVRLAAVQPLLINHHVTSALVQHDDRSVFNFKLTTLIERKELMLRLLLENKQVKENFRSYFPQLKSHTFSYISLHAALIGEKKSSMAYWWKGILASPACILKKRTLAIFKHLLLR